MRISDWSSDVCSFRSRLWVQTDSGATDAAEFGHNAMYYIDQKTGESKRLLVGPVGCEITGIAYNEDLPTFFLNIQPIGRASRRERVCQYVEHTDVDVAIKKQTCR